ALFPYYKNTNILECPSELALYSGKPATDTDNGGDYGNYLADDAPNSYIMNGWGDVYTNCWAGGVAVKQEPTLPEHRIASPALVIVIGEKRHSDSNDFWMDIEEIENGGKNNL